jgi:Flp pilus assembly protein TadD
MSTRVILLKGGLFAVCVFGVMEGATLRGQAKCAPPPALGNAVHTHPGAAAYVQLGRWYGQRHQNACAAEAFQAAYKFEPQSAQISYLLGTSLYLSGHLQDAIEALEHSVQIDAGVVETHVFLASALDEAGRGADAQTQWKLALKLDPNSAIALDGLSKSLVASGEYDAAVNLLLPRTSGSAHERDEPLTIDLAYAYEKAGRLDDASAVLEPALRAKPSSLSLTNALVTLLVHEARYEEAAVLANKALQSHPSNPEAQRIYLRILVLKGDTSVAPGLGEKLLSAAPHDPELLYLNGIMERTSGDYEKARTHLQESVALDPNNANTRAILGSVLGKLQDESGARTQLEKALALGAQEPQVHYDLASALRALGETGKAQEQLQMLQAKARATLAASKTAQADQQMTKGDPKVAVTLYQQALEATPQDALLEYKLAMAMDRTGDTAGEHRALDQAVQIDPTLTLAQYRLGYLASQNGDPATAEAHFRIAVHDAPDFTQAWVSLAATLGSESRFPEAKEAIDRALRLDPHNTDALQLSQMIKAAQAGR